MNAQSSEQKENNHLRVKISIDVIRWLSLQGCAFRGHDKNLPQEIKVIALN